MASYSADLSSIASSQLPKTTSSQQEAPRSSILLLTIVLKDCRQVTDTKRCWPAMLSVLPDSEAYSQMFLSEQLWRHSDNV